MRELAVIRSRHFRYLPDVMKIAFARIAMWQVPRRLGSAPPALGDRLRGVTLTGNLLVCGFVVGLGVWSTFAPLESAAIAFGTVESESSRKTIQHLEGGIIREILVADGDAVRGGQILISLEDTKARAEVQSLQGQLWDAMAREARLQAEQGGHERVLFPSDGRIRGPECGRGTGGHAEHGQMTFTGEELNARPFTRPGEMLEATPRTDRDATQRRGQSQPVFLARVQS
jgi:multidrug efflux pump subunit AcrA (membrane-fusion protein)